MSMGGIIAVSVVGGVVLIGVLVILYFTVFQHARLKKKCRDLISRFERSHGLLFGQDAQFIKRLETISSMNLTYVEDYNMWSRKYKDIRDVSDASAQAAVNAMRDYIGDRKYKDLAAHYDEYKRIIDGYEAGVSSLDGSLKNKFQSEEDCRTLAFQEREKLRANKQEYYSKQADLALVSQSFEVIFEKLDSLFEQVDQNIENAQYADAKDIIKTKIAPVDDSVQMALKNLPNICISIQSVIPDKLSSLRNRYTEMVSDGYPLYHICQKGDLDALEDDLNALAKKVSNFETSGADKEVDAIFKKIDDYMAEFQNELDAKKTFEGECDGIYRDETSVEQQFINLNHALPEIRKIYVFNSDDQAKIDGIQNIINKAGASKRLLDTYVHNAIRQPYSILVEKMHNLRDQTKEAKAAIADFQAFLKSLRDDCDKASQAVERYYERVTDVEKSIHDQGLDCLHATYDEKVEQIYVKIDALHNDLVHTPIDVRKVNADLSDLSSFADPVMDGYSDAVELLTKAEQTMVEANRYRSGSAEANSLLKQAEGLFYQGNFKQAYEAALTAQNRARDSLGPRRG
jgi:septation ring formation regulator EzrA